MFAAHSMYSQDITGRWNGTLAVQGTQLRLVFNIVKTDSGYRSTMDSPDQGAKGIAVTSTVFDGAILKLNLTNFKIEYSGVFNDSSIKGTFTQAGQSFPLDLSRTEVEKKVIPRPQEPLKPYPYYSEDVTFENKKANLTLAGTLTLPKKEGVFPVVVLITGSGPQNRDEELAGHKPFLVLSDYLTRNGIAVLRYDDRGVGQSKGEFKTATSADFASDVSAAVSYLHSRKDINPTKIGLIGHSEGGLIAPMVASRSKDIAFIVLLAGPGLPGNQLLLLQQAAIAKAAGVNDSAIQKAQALNKGAFDIVTKATNPQRLKTALTAYIKQISKNDPGKPAGMRDDDYVNLQVQQMSNPWMMYLLKYDPAVALVHVTCPVLAINGEKDLQVLPNENLNAIKKALAKGGNKKGTLKEIPGLNHLFQACNTGLPDEYAAIEQTFSPTALGVILQWIQLQVK